MLILAKTKTRLSSFKKAGLKKTTDKPTNRRPYQEANGRYSQQNKGTDKTQNVDYPFSSGNDVVRPGVNFYRQEPDKYPDHKTGNNIALLAVNN